ncbi:MAG: prepilin-type N-terminal cleavage/methylation domain-containing protein [Bacteroidetes bacterium]|nr:prepilin-type N-terminal cleavage/methylation domain-containing protein [Bacteroidota bacterium]
MRDGNDNASSKGDLKKPEFLNILRAAAGKKLPGFSLTELLIAMVILSVLVLLALPKLYPLVTKAKTKEAQIALATVKALQESYKLEHDRFAGTLEDLGFVQEKTVSEGGNAKYVVSISSASETGYEAKATALVDFDNDGTFNVWVVNEQGQVDEKIPD